MNVTCVSYKKINRYIIYVKDCVFTGGGRNRVNKKLAFDHNGQLQHGVKLPIMEYQ